MPNQACLTLMAAFDGLQMPSPTRKRKLTDMKRCDECRMVSKNRETLSSWSSNGQRQRMSSNTNCQQVFGENTELFCSEVRGCPSNTIASADLLFLLGSKLVSALVAHLVRHPAVPNSRSCHRHVLYDNETASGAYPYLGDLLISACQKGDVRFAKELLNQGGSKLLEYQGVHGTRPLGFAAYYGQNEIADLLADAGADIEGCDNEGWTPLIIASEQGHREAVSQLISRGANLNATTRYGYTAILFAALRGHLSTLSLLLESGRASVNHQSQSSGDTALQNAARNGDKNLVLLLLRYGACPFLRNLHGWDALTLAKQMGNTGCSTVLEDCTKPWSIERHFLFDIQHRKLVKTLLLTHQRTCVSQCSPVPVTSPTSIGSLPKDLVLYIIKFVPRNAAV